MEARVAADFSGDAAGWGGSTFFSFLAPAGLLEIGDESILERSAAPLLDEFPGRVDGEHLARMHQRDAVAALGLVHEVGREEDGDAVVAREIDQRAPELVRRPGRRPR